MQRVLLALGLATAIGGCDSARPPAVPLPTDGGRDARVMDGSIDAGDPIDGDLPDAPMAEGSRDSGPLPDGDPPALDAGRDAGGDGGGMACSGFMTPSSPCYTNGDCTLPATCVLPRVGECRSCFAVRMECDDDASCNPSDEDGGIMGLPDGGAGGGVERRFCITRQRHCTACPERTCEVACTTGSCRAGEVCDAQRCRAQRCMGELYVPPQLDVQPDGCGRR